MVARNELTVLNTVREMWSRGSIIDLTNFAPHFASRIGDCCVLEMTTMSDHRCIEFSILERRHLVNTGRGGKRWNTSRNTRQVSKNKLREHLEETRFINGLGWTKSRFQNSYQQIDDYKKDSLSGQSQSSKVHRAKLVFTRRVISVTGTKILCGPVRRSFHSRRTKEGGREV